VEAGVLWLTSGPASVLAEPIPAGVLTAGAVLQEPPAMIAAAEILPENLPAAWEDGQATALSIATALSQKFGRTLPWKTIQDVVTASLNARFLALDETSGAWPCDFPGARALKLRLSKGQRWTDDRLVAESRYRIAEAELDPSQIQDLGDLVPQLLEVKAKSNVPLTFAVRLKFGDGKEWPPDEAVQQLNKLLGDLKEGFSLK
jgi:hypothetical protein